MGSRYTKVRPIVASLALPGGRPWPDVAPRPRPPMSPLPAQCPVSLFTVSLSRRRARASLACAPSASRKVGSLGTSRRGLGRRESGESQSEGGTKHIYIAVPETDHALSQTPRRARGPLSFTPPRPRRRAHSADIRSVVRANDKRSTLWSRA